MTSWGPCRLLLLPLLEILPFATLDRRRRLASWADALGLGFSESCLERLGGDLSEVLFMVLPPPEASVWPS